MKKRKNKEEALTTPEVEQYDGYYSQDAYNNAYYGGQYVEPLDASSVNIQNVDPNVIVITPGRDGVPYNITDKGIENLTRIERLRRNGVISDANYNILWQKIISNFVR